MDLFDKNLEKSKPLANRMRPTTFKQFQGQEDIVGKGKLLRLAIENDQLMSVVFWGPPGTGKTTLAHVVANMTEAEFVEFSAVTSGVKHLREEMEKAINRKKLYNKKTILFIDEIHRWNKAQQDALLPHVERGEVVLIGATTENPSFELNSALLSRSRVFVLKALTKNDILKILLAAVKDKERGLGGFKIKSKTKADQKILEYLAELSSGDARIALNALEFAVKTAKLNKQKELIIDKKIIKEALQKTHLLYDKAGDEHYNIISALHKSMRGSDVDASLYWLARMLEAGENPLYIARRLVRFASEDIGLADPQAMVQAVTAYQACHFIGVPECSVNLSQAVAYMAQATKSNALYVAYETVKIDAQETMQLGVPLHLRNAPTKLMKDLNYSKGYKYNPDHEGDVSQEYLPPELKDKKWFSKNK